MGRDINGIAAIGSNTTNVLYQLGRSTVLPAEAFAPMAELAAPQGLANLPRPGVFVGREEALAWLDAVPDAPDASGGPVVRAVHGLGGVGKSTLVAHWAAARTPDHTVTWWITADSPAAIDAGLASLAIALQPATAGLVPLELLTERAVAWLATHHGWLLILDNVTDLADVEPLLARAAGGRFLITSRRATGWHRVPAAVIRLDALGQAEAVELLTGIVAKDRADAELDGAAELCAELGDLPLAIDQAAAYMRQVGIGPRAYLDLLARRPTKMYGQADEDVDAERTIARIWRVTLDRLTDTPLAGQVLRIVAWYAPAAIPRTILYPLADLPDVQEAIGRLAAHNMLTTVEDDTLTVHRLVQAVARTVDPDDPHRQEGDIRSALDQATRLLDHVCPADPLQPGGWPLWRALLPHVTALAGNAPPDTDSSVTGRLLNETGAFLNNQGAASRAIGYYQRAYTTLARTLGDDHPDTLATRSNLGDAHREAGDARRAIELMEQTLADCVRVLGGDHPRSVILRNNLAYVCREAGDVRRAIELHEQSLTECVRVLGDDHRDTLQLRSNLAGAYRVAGDVRRAIELHERTLADCVRVLGDDHPATLSSWSDLAYAYESAGDVRRAVELHERTLTARRRVLGDDHPQTLSSLNNLASAYSAAGNARRAVDLHEEALAAQRRVLGDDHPDTLGSRGTLARAYVAAGDVRQAVSLYERVLADCERLLGGDHPQTMTSRGDLATAYRVAGDVERAVPLFERTLADRARVLGDDHPQTLESRRNLAGAYQAAGDTLRAIPLMRRSLTASTRALGADHPDVLHIRAGLACAYHQVGNPGRAIRLFEEIFADCERVLGDDHELTRTVRANLAKLT